MELYSERIAALIKAALADGELTSKEREVLMKKAIEEGIDPDEFEMVLNARLIEHKTIKQNDITSPLLSNNNDSYGGRIANSIIKFLTAEKEEEPLEKDIHNTLPIPNTKSDLLDYIGNLKPKVRESEYYIDLYEECINKAKRLFPNDPSFHNYVEEFEDSVEDIRREVREKKEKRQQDNEDKKILFVFLFLLVNGFLGLLFLFLM